jgi:hypothetical protein
LKIESAETSVDVEDLADEKQMPARARFHARRIDLLQRNPAGGDLREVVAPTVANVEWRLEELVDKSAAIVTWQVCKGDITGDPRVRDPRAGHGPRKPRRERSR